jgi:hypothetical protein
MGMTCSLHRLTREEVEDLIRNPDDIREVLRLDQGPPVREVKPKGLLGFLLRLTPITITEVDPDAPPTDWIPDPEKEIDIEKAWHGLHFLFTGTSDEGEEPACYLLKGGEALDDDGCGRALRPDQVRRFAQFVSALHPGDLRRRFDAKRMMELEIYPGIWDRPVTEDEDPKEWLIGCFTAVQSFVQRAAAAGDAMVVYVS